MQVLDIRGNGVGLFLGQLMAFDHPLQHGLGALEGQVRVAGVGRRGIGQARQKHGFGVGEVGGGLAKVTLGGFLDAVAAAAEIDGVGVHLKDLLLRIGLFNVDGGKGFGRLAGHALFLCEQGVLGQLLGQGAAALGHGTAADVGDHGPEDSAWVNAFMGHEVLVLGGDHRVDVGLGQFVVGRVRGAGADGII